VVHCAAYVGEFAPWEVFHETNVAGTERLLAAARKAGVRRFIHISTEAVLFNGKHLHNVTEQAPYPRRQRYLYSSTKAEAEQAVLSAHGSGIETIVLRPRLVWGPRDAVVLPSLKRVVDQGSWFWVDGGKGTTSTTHVHNIVHAVQLAMHGGQSGNCYFIADAGTQNYRNFFSQLGATAGINFPNRGLPRWLLAPIGRILENLWRCTPLRGSPPFTEFGTGIFAATITVDTSKAQKKLGYHPIISVDEGLAQLHENRSTD
jgi:nucleoside-diphosphate-sugar epimerase